MMAKVGDLAVLTEPLRVWKCEGCGKHYGPDDAGRELAFACCATHRECIQCSQLTPGKHLLRCTECLREESFAISERFLDGAKLEPWDGKPVFDPYTFEEHASPLDCELACVNSGQRVPQFVYLGKRYEVTMPIAQEVQDWLLGGEAVSESEWPGHNAFMLALETWVLENVANMPWVVDQTRKTKVSWGEFE